MSTNEELAEEQFELPEKEIVQEEPSSNEEKFLGIKNTLNYGILLRFSISVIQLPIPEIKELEDIWACINSKQTSPSVSKSVSKGS